MQILIIRKVTSQESLSVACIPKLVKGAMGNELYFTAHAADCAGVMVFTASNATKPKKRTFMK